MYTHFLWTKKPSFNDTSGAGLAELTRDYVILGTLSLC